MRSVEPINDVLASFMAGEEHQKLLTELRHELPRVPKADVEEWLTESYIAGLRKCDADAPSAAYVLRGARRIDNPDFDFDALTGSPRSDFILKHLDREEQSEGKPRARPFWTQVFVLLYTYSFSTTGRGVSSLGAPRLARPDRFTLLRPESRKIAEWKSRRLELHPSAS